MTYAFIGLGNMAAAIIRGMRAAEAFEGLPLLGFDVDEEKARALAARTGLSLAPSAAEAIGQADLVVLAVKPQTLEGLLRENRGSFRPDQLVVSIAAGKPLDFYAGLLGGGQPVVRVMPSLLARVGRASSAICASPSVTAAQLDIARGIFAAVGSVHELPEALFPAFSAISGAAPAFTFQYIDALASAGVRAGLSRALAQQVAAEMVLGSAQMVREGALHPRALMDQVCSPGGTTIEGVHALDRQGFDHAVHQAVDAVIRKDRALGEA